MARVIDITGQRFGRLLAVMPAGTLNGHRAWLCICDCGEGTLQRAGVLRAGAVTSCGCYRAGMPMHGRAGSPAHRSWKAMLQRCTNANAVQWDYYGGRGIAVCDRWRSFAAFFEDMGERPPGMSLERIDNDGNYEPGNVRWATRTEQSRNRRPRRPKLSPPQIEVAATLRSEGASFRSIGRTLGVCGATVRRTLEAHA